MININNIANNYHKTVFCIYLKTSNIDILFFVKRQQCSAAVVEYLETRKDDAPSTASLTESWIKSHALPNMSPTSSEHSQSEEEKLSLQFARTELDEMRSKGAIPKRPLAHGDDFLSSTSTTGFEGGGGFGGYFGGGTVNVGTYPSGLGREGGGGFGYFGGGSVSVQTYPSTLPGYTPNQDSSFLDYGPQFRFRPSALQEVVEQRANASQPSGVPHSRPIVDMYGGAAPRPGTHQNVSIQAYPCAYSSREADQMDYSVPRSRPHQRFNQGPDAGPGNMWYTQPRMSTSAVGSGRYDNQVHQPSPALAQRQQQRQQQQQQQQQQPVPVPNQRHHQQLGQPGAIAAGFMNDVDTWIDNLDPNHRHVANPTMTGITTDVTLAYLVQQNLPRTTLPTFDGSPTKWVNFITKFRDVVHLQEYLNDTQRCLHLMQQLDGPAERSVSGYTHDSRGYVLSLKRLKFLFGRKSKVAPATIRSVTQGERIKRDDNEGLVEFYYTISDCLITLRLLNYVSDLYSTETLERATSRLPNDLLRKWGEKSITIRGRGVEPNLLHLEEWLQTRVLVIQEVQRPLEVPTSKAGGSRQKERSINTVQVGSCPSPSCGEKHKFWKCAVYLRLDPGHRFELVKSLKLCYNCLNNGHVLDQCTSKGTCFKKDCHDRHHTTLHKYYVPTVPPAKKPNDPGDPSTAAAKSSSSGSAGNQPVPVTTMGKYSASTKKVFLQIVPVRIHYGNRSCSTFALLDNGSESTLLRQDLSGKLGLKGKLVDVSVGTFKDEPEFMRFYDVKFGIASMDGKNRFQVDGGLVVPTERFHMPDRPRLTE